jgi:hypothetical protein
MIQSYLLNKGYAAFNSGTGPLAGGWGVLLIGGPRRYPDGVGTPQPLIAQSAFIAAINALANNTGINSLLANVASADLSTIWGAYTQAVSDGLQYLNNSVHPTTEGHGDIAAILYETLVNMVALGAITTSVPA